jgi:hypothetical protein
MSLNDYFILGSLVLFLWIIPSLLFIGHSLKLTYKMKWRIIATGLFTPWFIGILVKIYLDSLHKITLPWSYFLRPEGLIVFVPAMIWWGIPFIVIAYASQILIKKDFLGIQSQRGKYYLLMGTLVGAFIGASRIFLSVFWLFDAIIIIAPIWTLYFKDILIGLFIGWLIGRKIDSNNKSYDQNKKEIEQKTTVSISDKI